MCQSLRAGQSPTAEYSHTIVIGYTWAPAFARRSYSSSPSVIARYDASASARILSFSINRLHFAYLSCVRLPQRFLKVVHGVTYSPTITALPPPRSSVSSRTGQVWVYSSAEIVLEPGHGQALLRCSADAIMNKPPAKKTAVSMGSR